MTVVGRCSVLIANGDRWIDVHGTSITCMIPHVGRRGSSGHADADQVEPWTALLFGFYRQNLEHRMAVGAWEFIQFDSN